MPPRTTVLLRDLHASHGDAIISAYLFQHGEVIDMKRDAQGTVTAVMEVLSPLPTTGKAIIEGRAVTLEVVDVPREVRVVPSRYVSPTRRSSTFRGASVSLERKLSPPCDRSPNDGWHVPRSAQSATRTRKNSPARDAGFDDSDHFADIPAGIPKYSDNPQHRNKRSLEGGEHVQQPQRLQPQTSITAQPQFVYPSPNDRVLCAIVPEWAARMLRPELVKCWALYSEGTGALELLRTEVSPAMTASFNVQQSNTTTKRGDRRPFEKDRRYSGKS